MKDSAFFYCPVGSKWQNVLYSPQLGVSTKKYYQLFLGCMSSEFHCLSYFNCSPKFNGVASNTQSLALCLYDELLSKSPKVTSWITYVIDSVSLTVHHWFQSFFAWQSLLQGGTNSSDTKDYFCRKGQYNDMATLFFASQESAIRQLFHLDGKATMFKSPFQVVWF